MSGTKAKKSFLTISVDDGHPDDLRTADLLREFGLKATFYIPKNNPERAVMNENQMRSLATDFEIGGHTISHLSLTSMNLDQAKTEICDGKKWLEDCLGKTALAFCYPQGKFNENIARLVEEAGFLCGRTCLFNLNDWPANPYRWGVSTHGYSHSALIQLRHALVEANWKGASNYLSVFKRSTEWEEHFTHALDRVEMYGGVAHLFFHSWEIDQMNHWGKLRRVLEAASKRDLIRVTNGELFASEMMKS